MIRMEKDNNQNTKPEASVTKSPSIKYEECYEFIGFNKKDEEGPSLVIEGQQTDICEEPVISSPKVAGDKRRRKSASPSPSPRVLDLKSYSSNVGEKEETGLGGTTDFKKERKALLQKLRRQEISKMKKDLRDRLPGHIKSITKLETSSLYKGLNIYADELKSEMENLQFEFYRAERQNIILRRKLADLEEDESTWPYEITESSEKITIRKRWDHFVF